MTQLALGILGLVAICGFGMWFISKMTDKATMRPKLPPRTEAEAKAADEPTYVESQQRLWNEAKRQSRGF